MNRWLPVLFLSLLLVVSCSTAKPVAEERVEVDPVTDPSVVGAVDEAVLQGSIEGVEGAIIGRRVGRVAGVLAAVFGGPKEEFDFEMLERYRNTRDAVTAAGAIIGTTHGAVEGAKRGYEMDLQFAELHAIEGVEVLRPYPDQIEAYFATAPSDETLQKVAAVFAGREERAIDLEGDHAADLRDALIDRGVPESSFAIRGSDRLDGVLMVIRYRS